MRTKLFFTNLFLLFLSVMPMKAQSYSQLWKEAEKLKKEDRPQSALATSDRIFAKAEKEKDYPQKLKAFLYRMEIRQRLSTDSLYVDMQQLEKMTASSDHPVEKALLHSLLAEQYSGFAQNNQWELTQRATITGDVPEDMREWSTSIFLDRIDFHNKASLADSISLLNEKPDQWQAVITKGETGGFFNNDLYHMLGKRAIVNYDQVKYLAASLSPQSDLNLDEPFTDTDQWMIRQRTKEGAFDFTGEIMQVYRKLLSTYKDRGNDNAVVLLTLDLFQWASGNTFSRDNSPGREVTPENIPYVKALNRLIDRYNKSEVTAEAYLAKARILRQNNFNREALATLEEGIKKYTWYFRINALKEVKDEILRPAVQVTINGSLYPGDSVPLRVSHRNADGFTLKLHRVKLPADSPQLSGKNIPKSAITETISHAFTLERTADYTLNDTTVYFTLPEKGLWLTEVTASPMGNEYTQNVISVTTLKVAQHELPGKQVEFIVTDSKSGAPVQGARVILYSYEKGTRSEIAILNTDKEGRAISGNEKRIAYVRAETAEDNFMQVQDVRMNGIFREEQEQDEEGLQLLTDRTIYRPGQTVFLKGISYKQKGAIAQVSTGKVFTVRLLDVNNREVSSKELISNEYGSFTTEFVLPTATLNGVFSIEVNRTRIWIRVEEYKRPTFTVTFDPQEKSYRLGDRVTLTGEAKTYSGVPLTATPLRFVINRIPRSWWRVIREPSVLLLTGDTVTDSNGKFEITFDLEGANDHDPEGSYYNFTVEAVLTIPAGETQSAVTTLAVGNRSLVLDTDLPYDMLKEETIKAAFFVSNLNGQPIATTVRYQLYRKNEKEMILNGEAEANRPVDLSAWQTLPSGEYSIKLTATDQQGREADLEREFTLYSLYDTRPPVTTPVWFKVIRDTFSQQSPASLLFGSSEKEVWLYYDVFSGNRRLESKLIQLSDSILRFDYPYREEYKEGLFVSFMFIKDGQMNYTPVELRKSREDKNLKMNWEVFRDKLRPGQSEEWRLTIKTPDGNAANAELLALLYDASLDQFSPNNQELKTDYYQQVSSSHWYTAYAPVAGYWINYRPKYFKYDALSYNLLYKKKDYRFILDHENYTYRTLFKRTRAVNLNSGEELSDLIFEEELLPRAMADAPVQTYSADNVERLESKPERGSITSGEATGGKDAIQLRTGFAETAFFYPQLRTNGNGEVVVSFTLPESLTQWNFRGYAHTKEMLTGMLTAQATASKEFMLSPNLPRYLRTGDETVLAASVMNRSEKEVIGTAMLQLFDPETEKMVEELKQPFSVKAGETTTVRFTYKADDQYSLLGCRIVAQGDGFSDGEQHLLPVLSNQQWVTETLAIPLREEEQQTISLENLFNGQSKSASNRRLTVELTANPVWYAIQALPVISNPLNDDAISYASAWFANSLATWIMNNTPGVKQLVEVWQKEGGTSETLWSGLQKNSDLKEILLAETPWVLQAEREEEQKQRLALLFDLNTLRNNNRAALDKLKELQFPGGGWPWYKGMQESDFVTLFVTESLVRLPLLTGEPLEEDALRMLNEAMVYLRIGAKSAYEKILEREKKGEKAIGIPFGTLFYLYLTAIAPEADEAVEARKVRDYFISRLPDANPQLSISEKAWAAIVLDRAGRKEEANRFITSIREYLTTSPEMGMFFDTPWGTGWADLKLPRHLKAMEAIRLLSGDKQVLDEMTLWLLKQKQSQAWNSSLSTVEAVYEIVAGNREMASKSNIVTATIGKEKISTENGTPGVHYIKRSFTDNAAVNREEIKIRKEGEGVAWGAIYAQYMEETDRLQAYSGELKVTKNLYVERLRNNQAELIPVAAGTALKTGDKVVARLTITLDRDMDFVQLKDSRAACFEPLDNLSGYRYGSSTGYYVEVKDASTNFFFDRLRKGVYVLEYDYRVNREGNYSAGTATVQSVYAPEFSAHSDAKRIVVE